MAGKSAVPLLLIAGGAALLIGGKKKKKKDSGYETPEGLSPDEDFPVYVPPSPPKKPPPGTPSKPAGPPPLGDSYDAGYWGATSEERLISIRQHFKNLGYSLEVGPWPVNKLGPKGTVELKNEDGTMGKLGGKDDVPSPIASTFQREYNAVSKMNISDKMFPAKMGGLDVDGKVGPFTLNGLRYVTGAMPGGKTWKDLVLQASTKGFIS